MVNTAEQTARNAEAIDFNPVGLCLQWCRERADIPAFYGTAAIAAAHATDMHHDLDVPRGGFAYWTGGSDGAGHIAIGLGNGVVRSTDAGGPGQVANKPVEWFATNWHLTYVGWADNVNGVTVPGVGDDMPLNDADKAWIVQAIKENTPTPPQPPSPGDIAGAVGAHIVREASGTRKALTLRAAIRETFEKVTGR